MLLIKNRRAATEWTVGKLMTIILAIVLLALIIYGVSTGGINPLVEKAEGMFNNILSLFGAGEDGNGGEGQVVTKFVNIPGVGNGTLTISKDSCKVEFDYGPLYNLNFDSKDLEQWDFVKKKYIRRRTIFWSEDINLANWTRNLRETLMEKENDFILNYNNTNYSIPFFELLDTFEKTGEKEKREEFYEAMHDSVNKKGLLFFEGKKGLIWGWKVPPLLYFTPGGLGSGWSYGIDSEDFFYKRKFGEPRDKWSKFEKQKYYQYYYIYVSDTEWETWVRNTKIKRFLDEEC